MLAETAPSSILIAGTSKVESASASIREDRYFVDPVAESIGDEHHVRACHQVEHVPVLLGRYRVTGAWWPGRNAVDADPAPFARIGR